MSFRYYLSLQAELDSSTPVEFIEWVRSAIEGEVPEPTFEVDELTASFIDDAAWLLGLPGAASLTESDRWSRRLHVHAKVHESAVGAVYGLPALVARHCGDGMIGAAWTDMNDVEPSLFLVQRRTLFVGDRNGVPVPMVEAPSPPLVWQLGIERRTADEIERLVPSEAIELLRREHDVGEAALARFLFLRTVVRRLRGFDPRRDLPETSDGGEQPWADAARWGAEVVLETLDLGGDPLVVKDTPGWLLGEVEGRRRYSTSAQPVRTSGRPLTRLAGALVEMDGIDIDAGPRPFVEGEIVETVVPVAMVAHGPFIWSEDHLGRRSGSDHQLDVLVPKGSLLEVITAYEKGHATCRRSGAAGDFTPWMQPRSHPSPQPEQPVAPMTDYVLWMLRPEEEGSVFVRVAAPERN